MLRLTLLLLIASAPACFSDHVPPPTFRFNCDDDDECSGDEACIDGLCQVPCTQINGAEDCPSALGYVGCFNGVCTNLCQPPDEDEDEGDPCPSPQQCLDLGISIDEEGNFGMTTSTDIGLCIAECEEGTCPDGEVCVEGLCAIACVEDMDCLDEQICLSGVCVPEEVTEDRSATPKAAPEGEHR